jgi:hypothetical protein
LNSVQICDPVSRSRSTTAIVVESCAPEDLFF